MMKTAEFGDKIGGKLGEFRGRTFKEVKRYAYTRYPPTVPLQEFTASLLIFLAEMEKRS